MNIHSFMDSIRGWVPEEPKMPKHRFKLVPKQNFALFMGITSLFLMVSPLVLSVSPLVAAPLSMVVESAPNSSYVELKGVLQDDNVFWIVLSNGTSVKSENLKLSFLITETGANKCVVNTVLECDTFSREAVVDGSIVDGNLVVDSRQSLFLIDTNVTQNPYYVVLTEKDDWTLNAYLRNEPSHPTTAVEPYGVTALMASSSGSHPSAVTLQMFMLGYDPNSGILVYSAYSLCDVLLEKMGVDLLYGGSLKLVSCSENLNLEFYDWELFWSQNNIKVICFVVGFVLLVALSVIVVVLLIIRKRRELRTLDTTNLHVNGKQI